MAGEIGVIHPRGEWGPSIDVSILNNKDSLDLSYEDAIDFLYNRELDFYHSIFPEGNSLEEFLKKIRDLFNVNENDKKIFNQFSNARLKRFLPDIKPPVFERGYELIVEGDSELIDFSFLESNFVKIEGTKKFWISVIPENVQIIKQVLNKGLQRKTGGFSNAFEDNDKITRNLENILKIGEGDSKKIGDVFTVKISKNEEKNRYKEFDVIRFASKKNGEGYWTKKELEALRKNPNSPEAQQVLAEIKEANAYIKDFLFKNYNNASQNMKDAMNISWNSIGGDDTLQNIFFFEGENYKKIVLGQIGEFSNLVLNNFLKLSADKNALPPKLIQIIGSDFSKSGQQYHSDIEILLACGASVNQQTKNIGEYKDIPVNTSADLVEPIFGEEVISPLVNYFAAKDYASLHSDLIDKFKEIFKQNFYAAMNFNVSDKLQIKEVAKQMNTFYFISGKHLVPGSEILKTLKDNQEIGKGPSFNISGKNIKGYTEEEFEKKYKTNYIWKYEDGSEQKGENMIPSSYNEPLYQKDLANISIQTSFSIPALLKSGNFRIF